MTRHPIRWTDLRGAAVGLFGLGVEGGANLRALRALGVAPVLVDERPDLDQVDGLEVLHGAAGQQALARCDVVVKTPGISRYRPEVVALEAAGVPVVGGLGLWLAGVDRSRVALVTGTKGKSTTTAVAAHLARGLGYPVMAGGNLGRPPWDPDAAPADRWIIETSSFQATDLAHSPPVVAVTALHPDHLDWHGDAETYFADKLSATSQPGAERTVADATSDALRAREALLGPDVRWVGGGPLPRHGWWDALALPGPHNVRNALVAAAVLEEMGLVAAGDADRLGAAAPGFDPLESRLRRLATVAGVDYVDDSLSTNVLAALAALDTFAGRRVALLVGGHDRGIDYAPLAAGIAARAAPTLVVTMPDSGPRIGAAVRAGTAEGVTVVDAGDLDEAVALAAGWCGPGDVVLLSPAAPSFGRFRDYRQRAEAFGAAVAALGS